MTRRNLRLRLQASAGGWLAAAGLGAMFACSAPAPAHEPGSTAQAPTLARPDRSGSGQREVAAASAVADTVSCSGDLPGVRDGESQVATSRLGPAGGEIALAAIGRARFARGVLPRETTVRLAVTSTLETAGDFVETAPVDAAQRLPWELRVSVGPVQPAGSVTVVFPVPRGVATGCRLVPFVQLYQRGEQDVLDGFVRSPSVLTADALTLDLPPDAFTNVRRTDRTFEAVVALTLLPGPR